MICEPPLFVGVRLFLLGVDRSPFVRSSFVRALGARGGAVAARWLGTGWTNGARPRGSTCRRGTATRRQAPALDGSPRSPASCHEARPRPSRWSREHGGRRSFRRQRHAKRLPERSNGVQSGMAMVNCAQNLPTPCLWQAAASAQKTKKEHQAGKPARGFCRRSALWRTPAAEVLPMNTTYVVF